MASKLYVIIQAAAKNFNSTMSAVTKRMKQWTQTVTKETKKQAKAVKDAGKDTGKDSFMSAGWFAKRARWFAQLRAFWAIWQGLAKAVAGAFEFEQGMANVKAITQATASQFEELRKKALEVGTTTRFSSAEAAKGMVVMSQAGLSVVEILESITNVANLATATLFDFERTTSLVVTIMRAWNLTSKDSREITDTLATAINSTKLNMEALVAGFNFVSGIAPQMNLNLQETTALLGTLANRGLSASTAATSLRAVMAALLNPTEKFQRVLKDVGLTIADVDPQALELTTILKTLKDAGFGASEAFRAFRRRAAAGAAILISSAEEVHQLSSAMVENGRAAQMAAINLNTVSGQWKQFEDQMIANADAIFQHVEPALIVVIQAFKSLLSVVFSLLSPLAKVFSTIAKGFQMIKMLGVDGKESIITNDAIDAIFEFTSKLKDADEAIQRAVSSSRRLAEIQKKINAEAKDAVLQDSKGKKTDEMDRAIKIAQQNKLITFEQAKAIKVLTTEKEKQVVLEGLIGDEVERQNRNLARTLHKQKIIKDVFEKGRLEIVQERTRAVWSMFEADDAVFQKAKKAHELAKDTLKVQLEIQQAGDADPSQFLLDDAVTGEAKTSTAFKNATENRIKSLTNFFNIVQASGPLVKEIIMDLGTEAEAFVEAILQSHSPGRVDAVLKKIAIALQSGRTATPEMLADLKKEVGLVGEVKSKYVETNAEAIIRLKDHNSLLAVEVKELKQEEKALSDSNDTEEERIVLMDQVTSKQKKINNNNIEIVGHGIKDNKNKVRGLKLDNKVLDATNLRWAANLRLKKVLSDVSDMRLDNEGQIKVMQKMNQLFDLRGRKQVDILRSQQSINRLRIKEIDAEVIMLESKRGLEAADKELDKLARQRATLSGEIAVNIERQLLATSALARWNAKLAADPLNFRDTQEFLNAPGGIIDTLIGASGEGLETALTDITNLWAEQRAEVRGLEEELEGLNTQYQEALSDGNLERARELEREMSNLRNQIDDLNDPLKNLANTFRVFALSVLKELQKVIIKMLVVKLIGMALGMFSGGMSAGAGFGIDALSADVTGLPIAKGSGGIVPGGTFGNFRKFARGGVTSGIGAAILGDNPSGKELVIPSENISDDKVSGSVRDGQTPINIVNILTEQDIANAMAGAEGQRTIINTIGKDIGKRGPTYRAMKT